MAERPAPQTEAAARRLSEYRPPAFLVDTVDLIFDLDPRETRVRARLALRRNPAHGDPVAALSLDGEALDLRAVLLDGEPLGPNRYMLTPGRLVIGDVPDEFVLDTDVTIAPEHNTELSGLYVSRGDFFTQCEAEGFRRITFFPDRPDVMTRYTATLIGDPARCGVMLSNGNPVDRGTLPDGRKWVKWEDPYPKPSYLFALVAGDLVSVHDEFVTKSERKVALGIHVRRGDEDKVDHAMACLKRAMRWDEEAFGLEYDLDIFNIAAVSDFNMGAMENKGLNIFNTSLVLARPDTATDVDYERIDRVIAHEYFHNWTGDRVTCRDWFQLSLKEGLTVFRDQEYGADMTDAALSRIDDVKMLRARQFTEDAGPLAHPVRPSSYRKIDNFYTATIYEKGAEVVRMIRTIIGRDAFRRGFDLYIARNDNSAATIEDFIAAMREASGFDFGPFMRWYDQAGTPRVGFEGAYDAELRTYRLTLRQETPATPGQPDKAPFVIPVALGLIGPDGQDMKLRLAGEASATAGTRVLLLDAAETSFVFEGVPAAPVPSLLRHFSAPVKLEGHTPAQLGFLAAHDSDGFNRWEAGQQYATGVMLDGIAAQQRGEALAVDAALLDAMEAALDMAPAAPALAARMLALPGKDVISNRMAVIDPDAIHEVRDAYRAAIGRHLGARLADAYRACEDRGAFSLDPVSVGRRALRNVLLAYMMIADQEAALPLVVRAFETAPTMTGRLGALGLLADAATPARDAALATFHDTWRHDALVIDKWFRIQAMGQASDTLSRMDALAGHPDFDIRTPNRFRALVAAFGAGNQRWFHDASGQGYALVSRLILEVDRVNRQIAARCIDVFANWRRFDPQRQALMCGALDTILADPGLSANAREMAERARAG